MPVAPSIPRPANQRDPFDHEDEPDVEPQDTTEDLSEPQPVTTLKRTGPRPVMANPPPVDQPVQREEQGPWWARQATPGTVISEDPNARHSDVIANLETQHQEAFRQAHPFLPSGWAPQPSQREVQTTLTQADLAARQVEIGRRRAALEETKGTNATLEAQMRGTGQKFYTDPFGRIQPIIEPGTNRPMFNVTPWEEGTNPQTGEPSLTKTDRYGQRQFKTPPVVASPDLTDNQLYYKFADNDLRPIGKIEDLKTSKNLGVARAAIRAARLRRAAMWKEAIDPMEQIASTASTNFDLAQQNHDELAGQAQDLQGKIDQISAHPQFNETTGGIMGIGAEPSPVARQLQANQAALQSQLDQVTKQQGDLAGQIKPGGELYRQRRQATLDLAIFKSKAAHDHYSDLADERRAILRQQGKPEEGDATLDSILQAQQTYGTAISRAATISQRHAAANPPGASLPQAAGEPGAQPEQAPAQAPAALSATQSEPFALAGRGIRAVGGKTVQDLARLYGSGEQGFQPNSLLAIKGRIDDIDKTLLHQGHPAQPGVIFQSPGTMLDPKVIKSLGDEREYLNNLFTQRFARLDPEMQKTVERVLGDQTTSAGGAAGRAALTNVGPTAAFALGFAHGGAFASRVIQGPPAVKGIGTILSGIALGTLYSIAANKAQDALLKKAAPEFHDRLQQWQAKDWEQHPFAAEAGQLAGTAAVFKPSPLMAIRGIGALTKIAKGEAISEAEQGAARALAMQSGLATAQSLATPLVQGEKPQPGQIAASVAQMLLFGETWMKGRKGPGRAGEAKTPDQQAAEAEFQRRLNEKVAPPEGQSAEALAAAQPPRPFERGPVTDVTRIPQPVPVPKSARESAEAFEPALKEQANRPPPAKSAADSALAFQQAVKEAETPPRVIAPPPPEQRLGLPTGEKALTPDQQERATAIDQQLTEAERLRQSPEGATKLAEQLRGQQGEPPAAAPEPAVKEPTPPKPAPEGAAKALPPDTEFLYEQNGHRYYQVDRMPESPRGRTVDEATLKAEGYDISKLPVEKPAQPQSEGTPNAIATRQEPTGPTAELSRAAARPAVPANPEEIRPREGAGANAGNRAGQGAGVGAPQEGPEAVRKGVGPNVGSVVRFSENTLNGPKPRIGRVTRIMPDGRVEVKAQQGGYHTFDPADVTAPPSAEAVKPRPEGKASTPAVREKVPPSGGKGYSIDFESADGNRRTVRVFRAKYADLSPDMKAMVDREHKASLEHHEKEFGTWDKIKLGKQQITVEEHTNSKGETSQSVTLDSPEQAFGQWAKRSDLYDAKFNESGGKLRDQLETERQAKEAATAKAESERRASDEKRRSEFQTYKSAIEKVQLPTGQKAVIRISSKEGKPLVLDGTRYGDFLIHKTGDPTKYRPNVYRVTHIPSELGISGDGFASLAEAKNYVRALMDAKVRTDWKNPTDLKPAELDAIKEVGKAWLAGGDIPKYFKGESAPRPSDKIIAALEAAKIHRPGEIMSGDPFTLAYDGALDMAIYGIKAGRAVADVIKLAVQRFRARFPDASEDDVARLTEDIRRAHGVPAAAPETRQTMGAIRQRIAASMAKGDIENAMTYTRDAVDNKAGVYGREQANSVGNDLERSFAAKADLQKSRDALAFAVESGGDAAKLDAMAAKITGSTKANPKWAARALSAIAFAKQNLAKLKPIVDRYNEITDQQVGDENASGIDTLRRQNYVMHRQDIDTSLGHPFAGGAGDFAGFRKNRVHDTFADSIAAGIDPVSLDAVNLLQSRVARGQQMINRGAWTEGLKGYTDPVTGKPLAVKVTYTERPDGSHYADAPTGYKIERVGAKEIAVMNGYEGLFSALNDPSSWGKSPIRRAAQKANATGKSMALLFDTFHLGRLAAWNAAIRANALGMLGGGTAVPKPFAYKRGLLLLDQTPAEISRMAREEGRSIADTKDLLDQKQKLGMALETGANFGRIADALHQELVRKIPGIGHFNKFLFEDFQRGAMSEIWLLEYGRQRAMGGNKALSDMEVARKVSQQVNTRFGNLGRQGIFKSARAQDTARMIALAPQWNEGLIQSEIGAVTGAVKSAANVAQGKGLATSMLTRSVATMVIGQFVANQLLNQYTRGKFTWENPEEGIGAKLSAWIPDKIGGGPGFFLHPMGIGAEISHLLMARYEKNPNLLKAAGSLVRSRLSVAGRAAVIPGMALLGTTPTNSMGQLIRPEDLWKETAKAAVPLPIPTSPIAGAAKQLATGEPGEKFAGQFQKQLLASGGLKLDQAPSNLQRIQGLAAKFNREHKVEAGGEYYTGDYSDLTHALAMKNPTDAQVALEDLLKKKSPEQIVRSYINFAKSPFTHSAARESEFLRTLTPEETHTLALAKKERLLIQRAANQALVRYLATHPVPGKQEALQLIRQY